MSQRIRKLFQRKPKNPSMVDPTTSAIENTIASSTTTATVQKKIFPSGIKQLHNSENSVVDIVLVHGLTGDRDRTWTAKNAEKPWPQSLLPSKVPNARVLTFGYDAYVSDWRGVVSQNRIGNHSMNLLTSIATFREDDDTNKRPIIFICHSLGGLVCEDALSAAGRRPERHLQAIIDCTCGILFLGTPHHGSGLAKWAETLAVKIGVLKQTNSNILAVLKSDSEVLARVQDEFHTMVRSRNQKRLQPIEITCFFEELPLPGVGVVVPKNSAILPGYIPIGIHSNHMDMTKFEREDEPGFIAIAGELRRWIKELTDLNMQQHASQYSINYSERNISDSWTPCLRDLRTTDPRADKKRIEQTKGGLLRDSYRWILSHSDFQQWRNKKQSRLLWIKGDPGKGKTMLLCGIIDEMSSGKDATTLMSYFFCQATDIRINSATAVLRGLIYLLADQQPALLKHVQKKYDIAGKELFTDRNAWFALSEIFTSILQDPMLESTCLIIDALDECVTGLPQLLQFIDKTSLDYPRVKWIISSRNWPNIEEQLNTSDQKVQLRLELNHDSISAAVSTYIEYKVRELARIKKYNAELENLVRECLSLSADTTFLWVALVLQVLEKTDRQNALKRAKEFPSGLGPLYKQMMAQVSNSDNADLCKRILSIVAVVYRPITLKELLLLNDEDSKFDNLEDIEDLEQTVGQCGSFLTIRESTVYFVHQSAKEYLLEENTSQEIFPTGVKEVHYTILSRSLQIMSRILRPDIYSLRIVGISIDKVQPPDPDPLAAIRYSCLYWVDHLCDVEKESINSLEDSGSVHSFLRQSFLYWLEALSLMKCMSDGITMIRKLESLQFDGSPNLYAFIYDARRFSLYNRSVIEQTPLQSYCSALIFSPEKSIVKKTFEKCIPTWIESKPKVNGHWSAALQTLEGHTDYVMSVAFSPDGKQVVSGSNDQTVRLWDATTGAALQTLEGHTDWVMSVAFSPDGKQVVSGSNDQTVRLWDATTGAALQTLEGHTGGVRSVAFSPDGKQVVSGSDDQTVRLWDATTGAALQTLEGHTGWVRSVAFSPDGKQVVSGSGDQTVRLWDATTGAALQTLKGHTDWVRSVAFSPDGKLLPILRVFNDWVIEDDMNILWLPSEYRKRCLATWNRSLVIAHVSGKISCFSFGKGLKHIKCN